MLCGKATRVIFPADFTNAADKAEVAFVAAAVIAKLVTEHRTVVQAGGCSGLWPLALSTHFEQVITFEPHPDNFACLSANTEARSNVMAVNAAVGNRECTVGLSRTKAQAGLWRVDGEGDIPMLRIDDIVGEVPVDALVLDVEGSELQAMQGAARTIERDHPLIWFECAEHHDEILALLQSYGYVTPRSGIYLDYYSVHASRMAALA